jgi:putative ABC transport system permease protein
MPLTEDLRFSLRGLRKAPGFTTAAVLALGLGIGANVAIFSLVDAMLLRPLPLADPGRLVQVWEDGSNIGFPRDTPAPANFADWQHRNHVFTDMAALGSSIYAITGDGAPQQVVGNVVTANLFPLLGAAPILGRGILPEEDQPGAARVVLISYPLWQQRYGARSDVVGRDLLLDGVPRRIIGVMPLGFAFPDRSDVWMPIAFSSAQLAQRGNHSLNVFGRLKPGIAIADAQRDMSAIALQLAGEYPATNSKVGAVVVGLQEELLGKLQLGLWVLAGGVACVLLIACSNLAGLLLARAAGRQREMAVRAALGATRLDLVRQGVVESLVIAGAGGLAGILFAVWTVPLVAGLVPEALTGWAQPRIDVRLAAFATLISIASAILSGSLPALSMSRVDLSAALQQGGRACIGGRATVRRSLIVIQVALAVVLSVGAGLMVQTVWRLAHQDLGFHPEGVLTARTALPGTSQSPYREWTARAAFYQAVLDRVHALPGVVSAGYTTFLPLTNRGGTSGFQVEGAPEPDPGRPNDANRRAVSQNYLQTIGARLIGGRFFTAQDGAESMPVAIVNQAMATRFWPGQNPLGHRFRFDDERSPWITVVGIVGDIRQVGLDVAGRPEMYLPCTQPVGPQGFFTPRDLAVRVPGDPLRYAAALRAAVWSVDRNQPVADVQLLENLVDKELGTQRIQLWLLSAFAGLALLLASIGLYGLLSHMVMQRTRDIGVRIALGARGRQVLAQVMWQGLSLVGCGLMAGVMASWWTTRLMQKLLYGVKPTDLATFAVVAAALLLAGAAACYIPARRATRIDPMEALRL